MNPYRHRLAGPNDEASAPHFDDGLRLAILALALSRVVVGIGLHLFWTEETGLAILLVASSLFELTRARGRPARAPGPRVERRATKRFKLLT